MNPTCEQCHDEITDANGDLLKLARIKFRKSLCAYCYRTYRLDDRSQKLRTMMIVLKSALDWSEVELLGLATHLLEIATASENPCAEQSLRRSAMLGELAEVTFLRYGSLTQSPVALVKNVNV